MATNMTKTTGKTKTATKTIEIEIGILKGKTETEGISTVAFIRCLEE